MRIWLRIVTMGVALAAGPVWAADRALVLGNENYGDAADISGARGLRGAAQTLTAAGFQVLSGADIDTDRMRALLSDLLSKVQTQDRLVIVLAGHFAQSAGQTWFLGVEASQPDLVTVGAVGVNVASVLELAARLPGGAVVLLGSESRRLPLGAGLQPGIGALAVPQGVTLIRGDAGRIVDFAARQLTERGASLPVLLSAAPDLVASGFLAPD
ncbi:MAG: caspase family protein, partial [Paracoccaceae bacterium]|nr:caspase family protein [Paracoccaceae bacterium]